MDFGTFLLMQSPSARTSQEIYSRGVEVAQAAEALGFRNVWLAEHHFSTYGYLSRPAQLATYIAAKTTRLRVGTAVIVVPLHHPLVVAEQIATLDLLSGGRLDIGLGRGYPHSELARFGPEPEAGRQRWNMRVTVTLRHHYERVEKGHAVPVPAPTEPDVHDLLDRFLVIGTPDTCIRQIQRLRELVGITHFNCSFWFGDVEHARVLRSM